MLEMLRDINRNRSGRNLRRADRGRLHAAKGQLRRAFGREPAQPQRAKAR